MISDIRNRVRETPFRPFTVRTTSGHDYKVPTVDHIYFPPVGSSRVVVVDDEGATCTLWGLHIAAILDLDSSGASAAQTN